MKTSAFVLGLCVCVLSLSAFAHQEGREYDTEPLAKTCDDLAYPGRFELDPVFLEIKALKTRCQAAKNAAAKKAAAEKAAARKAAARKPAARAKARAAKKA